MTFPNLLSCCIGKLIERGTFDKVSRQRNALDDDWGSVSPTEGGPPEGSGLSTVVAQAADADDRLCSFFLPISKGAEEERFTSGVTRHATIAG